MELDGNRPAETISVNPDNEFPTGIVYLNKKRKLPAEQLGLPLPKHKLLDRSVTPARDCLCVGSSGPNGIHSFILEGENDGNARDDDPEVDSASDSNSFHEDSDISESVCSDAKADITYPKKFVCDQPSTSYTNWGDDPSKSTLYSLDNRLVTKASAEGEEWPLVDKERSSFHHTSGLHTNINFEEQNLEFENPPYYGNLGYRNGSIQQCADKEFEEMLCSRAVNPNTYVLSSGRWKVSQEAQPDSKKMTIDKEFEEYFSMLML